MPTPDVLVPNVPDLFWKKTGNSGWLYNGPVVFSAPDRYSREYLLKYNKDLSGALREKVGCVVGCVPDDLSTLWVFCWGDSFTEDEKVTVPENRLWLPLRFRGQVYEEGVTRAKSYLVDRIFPTLPVDQRVNVSWKWSPNDCSWMLTVENADASRTPHCWYFGADMYRHGTTVPELNGKVDYLTALAAAIKATNEAR